MTINKLYFTESEMEEQVVKLREYELDTWDHFMHYMKLVCSFGKKIVMTDRGIDYGDELMVKWKNQEELTRDENFTLILLGTEIAMLRKDKLDLPLIQRFYNEAIDKFKPSYEYMKEFAQETMIEREYCMDNPQYHKEMEKLHVFTSHYMEVGGIGGIPKSDKDLR